MWKLQQNCHQMFRFHATKKYFMSWSWLWFFQRRLQCGVTTQWTNQRNFVSHFKIPVLLLKRGLCSVLYAIQYLHHIWKRMFHENEMRKFWSNSDSTQNAVSAVAELVLQIVSHYVWSPERLGTRGLFLTIFRYKLVRPIQVREGGADFAYNVGLSSPNFLKFRRPWRRPAFTTLEVCFGLRGVTHCIICTVTDLKKEERKNDKKHDRFPNKYHNKYFGTSNLAEQAFWWSSDGPQLVIRLL